MFGGKLLGGGWARKPWEQGSGQRRQVSLLSGMPVAEALGGRGPRASPKSSNQQAAFNQHWLNQNHMLKSSWRVRENHRPKAVKRLSEPTSQFLTKMAIRRPEAGLTPCSC